MKARSGQELDQDNAEIELKLLINPSDANVIRKHALLDKYAVGKPHTEDMVSTYFDTPDFRVRRRDAALRTRKAGDAWLQTLKGGGKVEAGLHQRNEWECRVNGPALELPALRDMVGAHTSWGRLLRDPGLEERLAPIFTTRVTRTIWELRLPDGAEIEFALDLGTLERDAWSEPISEIELELKAGSPAALFQFAQQLLETVSLRIGNNSKAERGYALCMAMHPEAIKAKPVALSPDMSVEQGFKAIASNCLMQINSNAAAVEAGDDPEGVHQMRVGLRRLRAALGLFSETCPAPDPLKEEISWLAAELGTARDWDVLTGSTLPSMESKAPEDMALAPLIGAAVEVAHEKRKQALEAVQSTRYTRLMLQLAAWLQGMGWREHVDDTARKRLKAPLKDFADITLARSWHRLCKRGKRLKDADSQLRHRVRIAAKKTRYATEFFQSLYSGKRVENFVGALSRLQDELGSLNDGVTGDGLLRELLERKPDQAAEIAFVRGYLTGTAASKDRRLRKVWKRFVAMRPPWRKGSSS